MCLLPKMSKTELFAEALAGAQHFQRHFDLDRFVVLLRAYRLVEGALH